MKSDRSSNAPPPPGRRRRHARGRPGPGRPGGGSLDRGRRPDAGTVAPRTDQIPTGTPNLAVVGVLQISDRGHGLLRDPRADYAPSPADPIVPRSMILDGAFETGLELEGLAVADPGRAATLAVVRAINGEPPEAWSRRRPFKDLVAEDPSEARNLYGSESARPVRADLEARLQELRVHSLFQIFDSVPAALEGLVGAGSEAVAALAA